MYKAVHEDFGPASNAVIPSAAVLKQLLTDDLGREAEVIRQAEVEAT